MNKFNEATRVQIPAMIHLACLGYEYLGKIKDADAIVGDDFFDESNPRAFDPSNNILLNIFHKQFKRFNPNCPHSFKLVLNELRQSLRNEDLGRIFYRDFIQGHKYQCLDFEHPENNVFSFTAEFTCRNGDDKFRPDITLFINGLPLCFIEVKKPNNKDGIVAESERMNNARFPNKKFRAFFNITQLMIFSNNMEYSAEGGITPIQGAFYCTAADKSAPFNCFREEKSERDAVAPFHAHFNYLPVSEELKQNILDDFNAQVIANTPEFATNLHFNTPTNRILTSMCSKERLLFLIKYGIAYVSMKHEVDGKIESIYQKHIMRYQQMFACFAIKRKLLSGAQSGVVWHTQGSGKTALSFFLHRYLTDFYSKQGKLAKFYFIVDRLDLLEQAAQEFTARGLEVHTAKDRASLMQEFRLNQAYTGAGGNPEISVVNIQRFKDDTSAIEMPDYDSHLQRIFILDEAHRGYKPNGSFLAKLFAADESSIKIALTGTPLLKEECATSRVFSSYFHAYYFNSSLADGYTLRLIREDIQTEYREHLSAIYDLIGKELVQKKDVTNDFILSHPKYVEALCSYIERDFRDFRVIQNDDSVGGMIVCANSDQARAIFSYFKKQKQSFAETYGYQSNDLKRPLEVGLVLYDSDDKEAQKQLILDFKRRYKVDILIVFNMLLTGFDAPRLKRLYLGRKLKDHTLLQALTRVNRPHLSHKYGYIVDFADIKANFDKTNALYLQELGKFNSSDLVQVDDPLGLDNSFIVDNQEIVEQMKNIHNYIFDYAFDNMELFSEQISNESVSKAELVKLKANLIQAKDFANIVRTFGNAELKEQFAKLTFKNLSTMLKEVQARINLINQQELWQTDELTLNAMNQALMHIDFSFKKLSQEELTLLDGGRELNNKWQKVISNLGSIGDPDNPKFIELKQAFYERFKAKGFTISSVDDYKQTCKDLDDYSNKLNSILMSEKKILNKVHGDNKGLRFYNKIMSLNRGFATDKEQILSGNKEDICNFINQVKFEVDKCLSLQQQCLNNESYFSQQVSKIVLQCLVHVNGMDSSKIIRDLGTLSSFVTNEYLKEYSET